jgi:vacuolar-type H+-ATPase catalytic subunit A/Vma1
MQSNPLRSVEDPHVNAIYAVVKGRVSLLNIVPTCLDVAQEVEQISGLKGPQKLALLQDVLRLAVAESKHTHVVKEELLHTIDTIVPIAVQAAVLASKSPIFKKVQETCVGCFWTKA